MGFYSLQADCRGIENRESGGRGRKGFKSPAVQVWWRNLENFLEREKFLEVIHSILTLPYKTVAIFELGWTELWTFDL